MKGKIFPEVNSYGLDLLFSNIRSCAWLIKVLFEGISCIIVAHLIGILEIILKNAWQLLFSANGRKI